MTHTIKIKHRKGVIEVHSGESRITITIQKEEGLPPWTYYVALSPGEALILAKALLTGIDAWPDGLLDTWDRNVCK